MLKIFQFHNRKWYEFIPLVVGVMLVFGNLMISSPLWGFNYWILSLPYHSAGEQLANIAILYIGVYPIISGKNKYNDGLYFIIAVIISALFFAKGYNVLHLIIENTDLYVANQGLTGKLDLDQENSIYSTYPVKLLVFWGGMSYLLVSLRFGHVAWKSILLIAFTLISTSLVTTYYLIKQL